MSERRYLVQARWTDGRKPESHFFTSKLKAKEAVVLLRRAGATEANIVTVNNMIEHRDAARAWLDQPAGQGGEDS